MILKHENLDRLLEKYPIPNFNIDNVEHIELLNELSIAEIASNKGKLSNLPPMEKHPYLRQFDESADIYGLMIGTFPPITYLVDTLSLAKLEFGRQRGLKKPEIPFFHGNKNSFWKFSPFDFDRIIKHQDRAEKSSMIIDSLANKNILYTDIIRYCQRSFALDKKETVDKYSAKDVCLNNIYFNTEVYDFLFSNHKVDRLYFTNSYAFGKGEHFFTATGAYYLKNRDAFQLFLKGANDAGLKIEISLPENNLNWININEGERGKVEREKLNSILRTKVHLKLKLHRNGIIRFFDVVSSVSPSAIGGNRNKSEFNFCVINYSKINKVDIKMSCEGLIRESLRAFFNDDVKSLTKYNA